MAQVLLGRLHNSTHALSSGGKKKGPPKVPEAILQKKHARPSLDVLGKIFEMEFLHI